MVYRIRYTLLIAFSLWKINSLGCSISIPSIYFAKNSYELDSLANVTIQNIYQLTKNFPIGKLQFEGHSDGHECAVDDSTLSFKRDYAVRKALLSMDEKMCSNYPIKGCAGNYPRNDYTADQGKSSRRVEIKITKLLNPVFSSTYYYLDSLADAIQNEHLFLSQLDSLLSLDTTKKYAISLKISNRFESLKTLITSMCDNYLLLKYTDNNLSDEENKIANEKRNKLFAFAEKLIHKRANSIRQLLEKKGLLVSINTEPCCSDNKMEFKLYQLSCDFEE
jgi:outer membrane protein OmpA-like peptidoglycan-associated protein